MKPPIPRVFADVGRVLFDARVPDGQEMIVWGGVRVTAGDFKRAFAAYHGVSLAAFEQARRSRAAVAEGREP